MLRRPLFSRVFTTCRSRLLRQRQCNAFDPIASTTRGIASLALSPTSLRCKDVRRGDRGDSRRLTFEERAERRTGKSREQKVAKENLLQEAETVVNEDVPEELEHVYMQHFERANVSAMKVLNMAKCLELLEVDVGGGRKVPLAKVAHVVKTGNATLEVVPQTASFASAILQRVTRFDSTLRVTKEQQKIRVALPPITTGRRDRAVAEIEAQCSAFRLKAKSVRAHATRALQDAGLDESAVRELQTRLDENVNAFTEEKVAELQQLAEDVTSMGVDESDVGV
ncbi:ribosome recycling factor [Trypanosoma theileri]|uniref:Ribosome recycling factor n=1 Tax=Trypanosoma theileri TaxID=67003 RepID=A0A1X0P2I0_9TRYP|nr:ribosome recycling factor [Trypanosoma theileri]ORC91038.1 ribosome recycling factor [Trypanosoma theileri]